MNGLVSAAALPMARSTAAAASAETPGCGSRAVYYTIALSGLTALGAEVVWTRLLSLMLGPTVYAFSIILAVFLLGMGLGSIAASFLARRGIPPRAALGWCQILLAAGVGWTAFMLSHVLPWWPVSPFAGPYNTFRTDVARAALAVLPAACLWGASFPLAIAAAGCRRTGPVYAANTAGAIAGAIGFSLLLVPAVGSRQSERLLVLICGLAALPMLPRRAAWVPLLCGLLAWGVSPVPWGTVAYGRTATGN